MSLEALGETAEFTKKNMELEQPADEEVFSLLMLSSATSQTTSVDPGNESDTGDDLPKDTINKKRANFVVCFLCSSAGTDITCRSCDRAAHSFCVNKEIDVYTQSWSCSQCVQNSSHLKEKRSSPKTSPFTKKRKKQRKRCVHIEWKDRIEALENFRSQFGHVLVWRSWKGDHVGDFNLGMWVSNIRQAYKRGELQPEKIRQLEDLGFAWKANKAVSHREKIHNQLERKRKVVYVSNNDSNTSTISNHLTTPSKYANLLPPPHTIRTQPISKMQVHHIEPSTAHSLSMVMSPHSTVITSSSSPVCAPSPPSSISLERFSDMIQPPSGVDPESYFAYYTLLSKQNANGKRNKKDFSARRNDCRLPGNDSGENISGMSPTTLSRSHDKISSLLNETDQSPRTSHMGKISSLLINDTKGDNGAFSLPSFAEMMTKNTLLLPEVISKSVLPTMHSNIPSSF